MWWAAEARAWRIRLVSARATRRYVVCRVGYALKKVGLDPLRALLPGLRLRPAADSSVVPSICDLVEEIFAASPPAGRRRGRGELEGSKNRSEASVPRSSLSRGCPLSSARIALAAMSATAAARRLDSREPLPFGGLTVCIRPASEKDSTPSLVMSPWTLDSRSAKCKAGSASSRSPMRRCYPTTHAR